MNNGLSTLQFQSLSVSAQRPQNLPGRHTGQRNVRVPRVGQRLAAGDLRRRRTVRLQRLRTTACDSTRSPVRRTTPTSATETPRSGWSSEGRSCPARRDRSSTRRSSPIRIPAPRAPFSRGPFPCGGRRTGAAIGPFSRPTVRSSRRPRPTRVAATSSLSATAVPSTQLRRGLGKPGRRRGRGDHPGVAGHEHDVGGDEHRPRVHHRGRQRSGGGRRLDRIDPGTNDPTAPSARSLSIRRTRAMRGSIQRLQHQYAGQPGHVFEVTWTGTGAATWSIGVTTWPTSRSRLSSSKRHRRPLCRLRLRRDAPAQRPDHVDGGGHGASQRRGARFDDRSECPSALRRDARPQRLEAEPAVAIPRFDSRAAFGRPFCLRRSVSCARLGADARENPGHDAVAAVAGEGVERGHRAPARARSSRRRSPRARWSRVLTTSRVRSRHSAVSPVDMSSIGAARIPCDRSRAGRRPRPRESPASPERRRLSRVGPRRRRSMAISSPSDSSRRRPAGAGAAGRATRPRAG